MKKLLVVILFFTLNISYASFPVEKKESNIIQKDNKVNNTNSNEDTNIFAIISIITALISTGFLFYVGTNINEVLIMSLIFSIIAVISGVLGFKKKLKKLSYLGFFIGIITAVLTSSFLIFIQMALSIVNK